MQKYTEADIKQKFITPAIEAKWNRFTQIRCEYYFTDGRVIVHGRHTSRGKKSTQILHFSCVRMCLLP